MTSRGQASRDVLIAVLVAIGAWEIVGRLGLTFMIPPFTEVLASMDSVLAQRDFRASVLTTLANLGIGAGLALVIGVPLGVLMGRYRSIEYTFDTYINLLMAAPMVALVPVLVMIFGMGSEGIVAIVFLFSVPVIVVNTYTGVRQAGADLELMARSFGASEWQLFWTVVLPAALPMMMAGIRIGAGRAVKGIIVGEQLIVLAGLGGLIQRFGGGFQVRQLYFMILMVGLLGLAVMSGLQLLERRLTPWSQQQSLEV